MDFESFVLGPVHINDKSKFPYMIEILLFGFRTHKGNNRQYWDPLNIWMTENFGKYNETWRVNYDGYAFKDEEDLVAFKLLWG